MFKSIHFCWTHYTLTTSSLAIFVVKTYCHALIWSALEQFMLYTIIVVKLATETVKQTNNQTDKQRTNKGGHWNDAYDFVRLHQPAALYGVNSR